MSSHRDGAAGSKTIYGNLSGSEIGINSLANLERIEQTWVCCFKGESLAGGGFLGCHGTHTWVDAGDAAAGSKWFASLCAVDRAKLLAGRCTIDGAKRIN